MIFWRIAFFCYFALGCHAFLCAESGNFEQPLDSKWRTGYQGDISLRLELGPKIVDSFLTEEGMLSNRIGSEQVGLFLSFEYGYYFRDKTVFLISIPLEMEVVNNGTFVSMQIGLGIRHFLFPVLYVEMQIFLALFSGSVWQPRFDTIFLRPAVGVMLPVSKQFQLFLAIKSPIRLIPFSINPPQWIPFFSIGFDTVLGLQVLF